MTAALELVDESRLTLSIAETASALGVSEDTVQRAVKAGELPSFRLGRRTLVVRKGMESAILRAVGDPHQLREDLEAEEAAHAAAEAETARRKAIHENLRAEVLAAGVDDRHLAAFPLDWRKGDKLPRGVTAQTPSFVV